MMIDRLSEQEKRDNIVTHVDKNIFVEAGAGAGKTTLIVQRITNQIRQGRIKPEELVVITFTNKAAGELFERIQKAFQEEESNLDNSEEQRERFTYALEHIEQMHISTIHSFCFKLLKERCFDAKLPLGIKLLEDAQATERKEKFFDKWLAKLSKAEVNEVKKALFYFNKADYAYGTKLKELFVKICEKPDDTHFVMLSPEALEKLQEECILLTSQTDELLKVINDEIIQIAETGERIYEQELGFSISESAEALSRDFDTFLKYYKLGYPGQGKNIATFRKKVDQLYGSGEYPLCKKGSKKADKELYASINEKFDSWLYLNIRTKNTLRLWIDIDSKREEKTTAYAYYVLLKYAVQARDAFRRTVDVTELSNDQLIQKARDLVCESSEACSYFQDKYKCIYVDEFQDTDHIQAELVWKLASNQEEGLNPGALFVVGDPKQAIYRFRGGEPAVYFDIKKRMSEENCYTEVYELDNNYRSNNGIIPWINEKFAPPLNQSGVNYRDMICVSKNHPEEQLADEGKILRGVYYFDTLVNSSASKPVFKAIDEAAMLTDAIEEMVSGGYYIYENKKENDNYVRKLRPIHYGDFLILCWDTTQMDIYIQKFKEHSIPVELAGKSEVRGSTYRGFLALLRYVLNPTDAKCQQAAKHVVWRENLIVGEELSCKRIEQLLAETRDLNLYGKTYYLLQHLEYFLPWNTELSKEEMNDIQARMTQMVEGAFVMANESPEIILDKVEEFISKELERELLLSGEGKKVRFMNLHKAKGLEGNITILTNRKKKSTRERIPEYTASEKNANDGYEYYGVLSDNFSRIHGYGYDGDTEEILDLAQEQDMAEKIRLEYVAATRAKEVLIVTTMLGEGAAFSRYGVEDCTELLTVVKIDKSKQTKETEEIIEGAVSTFEKTSDEMLEKVYVTITPSMLEEKKEDTAEQNSSAVASDTRRPKGNILGTTMHRSFELYIQQRQESDCDVDVCITQAIIENADDLMAEGRKLYLRENEPSKVYLVAVKDFLHKALDKFRNDERMTELLNSAREIHTELPFSFYTSRPEDTELFDAIQRHLELHKIEVKNDQPVWINGNADLVVVDAEGKVHIIDFKSDSKGLESIQSFERELAYKYEGQLTLYKYAMMKVFDVKLEDVSTELYHLY